MKTRFVVVDENVFGCINPLQPNTIQILATSIIRGAIYTWMDGLCPVPMNDKRMRPAIRADFSTYRVSPSGYDADTVHYDFPQN